SEWMKPITMSLLPLPLAVEVDPPVAALMLELQASSSPPPPTTAALAPAVRNRPRRLIDPPALPPEGTTPPDPSAPGEMPSPQTPLAPPGPCGDLELSGCAALALLCRRAHLVVSPMARDRG